MPSERRGKIVIVKIAGFHLPSSGPRTPRGRERKSVKSDHGFSLFIICGEHREATKTQFAVALAQVELVTGWA